MLTRKQEIYVSMYTAVTGGKKWGLFDNVPNLSVDHIALSWVMFFIVCIDVDIWNLF